LGPKPVLLQENDKKALVVFAALPANQAIYRFLAKGNSQVTVVRCPTFTALIPAVRI
jgi:hypothetical protein